VHLSPPGMADGGAGFAAAKDVHIHVGSAFNRETAQTVLNLP